MKRKWIGWLCLLMLLLCAPALWGCGQKEGTEAGAGKAERNSSPQTHQSEQAESVVYMTKDISPEGLMRAYEALNWQPPAKAAVKLSTGEAGIQAGDAG